jgi:RES domain
MLSLWRLYRAQQGPGLDGIGGLFADGRWHTRGERVVYFGGSAAIVVLERLAHTDPDLLPGDLQLAMFEFAEPASDTKVEEFATLPAHWARPVAAARIFLSVNCPLRDSPGRTQLCAQSGASRRDAVAAGSCTAIHFRPAPDLAPLPL